MEFRHLRYFIAVADAGSLPVAAEQKLHTSQPSLSRQIRDLEQGVGVQLTTRSAHGVELTSVGKAFLDHSGRGGKGSSAARGSAAETGLTRFSNFQQPLIKGLPKQTFQSLDPF